MASESLIFYHGRDEPLYHAYSSSTDYTENRRRENESFIVWIELAKDNLYKQIGLATSKRPTDRCL